MFNIILIYLIVISIVALIFLFAKRTTSIRRRLTYTKRTYWMLGGYLMILLIATVAYLSIPKEEQAYSEQAIPDDPFFLANLVQEGKLLDEAEMYIQKQWKLPYDHHELQIVRPNNDDMDFDALISVERKTEDDGIVEITHYKIPIIVEGMDITGFMDPVEVELSSTELEVIGLEHVEVELNTYRSDFPARQFTEESWWLDMEHASGRHVLSLRIPSSLQITHVDENIEVHYVQD